ncbi:MAG: DUF5050 domain-containing protein [Clostridiaceae bacterium]
MKKLKITFMPKTGLGSIAFLTGIATVLMFLFKMMSPSGFPVPTFGIVGLGVVGFVLGIAAIIKKDRSIGSFFSVLIGLGIIAMFALIWISSLGLFKDFPVKATLTQAEAGKGLEKTANLGQVSESEGWVYYIYEDNLIKRKIDWTERTKLSDAAVSSLFISDGWIYYRGPEDERNLYKMKTDGTEMKKICSDRVFDYIVSGDWIFYTTSEVYESKEQLIPGTNITLHRMKTDGSDKTEFNKVMVETSFIVQGDWLYFVKNKNLYKIKTDGTGEVLMAENASVGHVYGDWIYFTVVSDQGEGMSKIAVNRIKTDGSERSVTFNESGVYMFDYYDEWLYYTTFKESMRIKLDGTGKEKMNEVEAWNLMGVAGDWMYISDYTGPMYRVKMDGSFGTRMK